MEISGRVQGGVIVLEGGASLPEGLTVTVTYPAATLENPPAVRKRVQLPLVHTGEPGTVNLTGQRLAELLDEEDISS